MFPVHHRDSFVAVGIVVCGILGLLFVGRTIHAGDSETIEEAKEDEEKRRLLEAEAQAMAISEARAHRESIVDDISIEHLDTLSRHPSYEIRKIVYKIILQRFQDDAYCSKELVRNYIHAHELHPEVDDDHALECNEAYRLHVFARKYEIDLPISFQDLALANIDWGRRMGAELAGRDSSSAETLSAQGLPARFDNEGIDRINPERWNALEGPGFRRAVYSRLDTELSAEERRLAHHRRREAMVLQEEDNEDGEEGDLVVVMPRERNDWVPSPPDDDAPGPYMI